VLLFLYPANLILLFTKSVGLLQQICWMFSLLDLYFVQITLETVDSEAKNKFLKLYFLFEPNESEALIG